MLIGVTGDTHNNIKNITKICEIFNAVNPSFILHTGDITLPKSLRVFSNLNMPLIGVFGNNDELEKSELELESKKFNCKLYEEPYLFRKNDKQICLLHHPALINEKLLKKSDFIIHGHTHRYRNEKNGKTLIFNPGECAGLMKGKNNIGLLEITTGKTEIISF